MLRYWIRRLTLTRSSDVFDRQRVIEGWDQSKIEAATCFVLGTGGLGMDVALALARLGVKKIILLDRDVYEASNLTRQVLGSLADATAGRRKVDVARDNLLAVHNLRSEIVTMHMDAVLNWGAVVEAARECDVVFNAIDFGAMFDLAVCALCKELGIPMVTGSSYGHTAIAEFQTGDPGDVCWRCRTPVDEIFKAHTVESRQKQTSEEVAKWLRDRGEDPAATLTPELLAAYLDDVLHMNAAEPFVLTSLETLKKPEGVDAAGVPAFLVELSRAVQAAMLPGEISKHTDISFVPREDHPPTRNFGSWVCVCVIAAMFMVNQWVQHLTGTNPEEVPALLNLYLNTSAADTDRMMGGLPTSDADCAVCKAAQALASEAGGTDGAGGAGGAAAS